MDRTSSTSPRRWPRGQKFTISLSGLRADEAYRAAVLNARASGRAALEAAVANWAVPYGVRPGDGVVLGELRSERRGLSDLASKLEECGIEAAEVRTAVDRLVSAGLVEPIPLASQLGV